MVVTQPTVTFVQQLCAAFIFIEFVLYIVLLKPLVLSYFYLFMQPFMA